jgi:murein DD-endopeptidase MepM/ murein hydrolase activator NlpD
VREPIGWSLPVGVVAALAAEVLLLGFASPARPILPAVDPPAERIRSAEALVAGLIQRRAPRVVISASVTGGGAPIEGATVSISDGSGPVLHTATTDDRGAATFDELEPGVYQLWATHRGQVSPLGRVSVAEGDASLTLALAPGARVEGRAVAARPLDPDARAVLIPVGLDHAVLFAAIDRDGGFAIDALPRGRWRLRLEIPDHVAAREVLFDAGDEPVSLEIPLRPTGQVTGLVVDSRGAPVANATLVLRRSDGRTVGRTGADWALSPAGIRWIHPLAVERHLPGREARRFGARRPGSRPPECGGGHCGVDVGGERGSVVHAAASGRLAAVVHDPSSLAGRFVAVEHDFGLKSFYMHLDEIRADLELGGRVAAGEPIGTLGSTGTRDYKPHLHLAISREIGGRPWFIDPEPMLHHAVVLPKPGSLTAVTRVLAGDGARSSKAPAGFEPITTDDAGRFEVGELPAGTYLATAYHEHLAPGTSAPFAIDSAATTRDVRVTLADGVVLFGQVHAGGQPISGVRVVAEEGAGEARRVVARATTDAAGRYELRPLSGELMVRALSRDLGEAEQPVKLADAGPRRQLDFELAILEADLRGRVMSPDGRGVAGASVQVIDGPPSARRRITTDASGRFSIPATSGGRYRVEVRSPEHPAAAATLDVDRDEVIALVEAGRISVEVRDAHTREPLAQIHVTAMGPDGARARAVTGDDGVAELAPVAVGRWQLSARKRGYTAASITTRVEAGRRAEPDLELARGAILAGVLRDADGTRIGGAEIRAGQATATTDRDGYFEIRDAPTGLIELRAIKGDLSSARTLELAPGDELVTLELRLE